MTTSISVEGDTDACGTLVTHSLIPGQESAVDAICDFFFHKRRAAGILKQPCGYGKTRAFVEVLCRALDDDHVDGVVIFCPLRVNVTQTRETVAHYLGTERQSVGVSSSHKGSDAAQSTLEAGGAVVACFESADKVLEAVRSLPGSNRLLVIVDEMHLLREAHLYTSGDPLYELQQRATHRLYVSATPLVQPPPNGGDPVDIESLVGPVIHETTYAEALEEGRVAPFEVIVPLLTQQEVDEEAAGGGVVVDPSACADGIISETLQAKFLLRGLLNTGARRCIVYLPTGPGRKAEELAARFTDALRNVCEEDVPVGEIIVNSVFGTDSSSKREEKLNNFGRNAPSNVQQGYNFHIMLSCQVLNQGVDLPMCDSVFILSLPPGGGTETQQATLWQRVQRATRAEPSRAYPKRAAVFLWGSPISALDAGLPDGPAQFDEPTLHAFSQLRRHGGSALERRSGGSGMVRMLRTDFTPIEEAESSAILERMHVDVQRVERGGSVVAGGVDERYEWRCKLYEKAHAANNGNVMRSTAIGDDERNEAKVGEWMNTQRKAKQKGTLSSERIARCERLPGWSWGDMRTHDQWCELYEKAHAANNGKVTVRTAIEDDEGNEAKVGNWVDRQRHAKQKGTLLSEQIARCEQLPGWSWGKGA